MIGTLGRKIIFEVSDNRVLTFESMSREVSGRWTEHEVLGVKPKAEFLGPGLQTISLTIHLSAALGVKPRRILDMVERMAALCGVKMEREKLRADAAKWEMRHPGRTPRTAKQFIAGLSL